MRQGVVVFLFHLVFYHPGFSQSALELQGGHKSVSFEHWYYSTLSTVSPRLEFFNYTFASWYHAGGRPNSTMVNPFLGYNLHNGIGVTTSIAFQNESVSPFLGLQFSKSSNAHSLFSALSYSPSYSGMAELFLWYVYQPANAGWKPFGQFNFVSNRGVIHNFTHLRIRFGPAFRAHAVGLAWDAEWDSSWSGFTNLGLFYRLQLH